MKEMEASLPDKHDDEDDHDNNGSKKVEPVREDAQLVLMIFLNTKN